MLQSFYIANECDIPLIQDIANASWHHHYPGIISIEQIDFMLGKMYNHEALREQMTKLGHTFILSVYENSYSIGFASFSQIDSEVWKLHKLYLLPEFKGSGLGKNLMQEVESTITSRGGQSLLLNVNRNNPSVHFYKNRGYTIIESIDVPYYQFVLNDYIMQKSLA